MSNDLPEITQKLDTLIKLVASGLIEGKTQREKIQLLSKAGLSPQEIAEFIETSPNTVRVELSVMRKAKKKRKK